MIGDHHDFAQGKRCSLAQLIGCCDRELPPIVENRVAGIGLGRIGIALGIKKREMVRCRQGELIVDPVRVADRLDSRDIVGAWAEGCLGQKPGGRIGISMVINPRRWGRRRIEA